MRLPEPLLGAASTDFVEGAVALSLVKAAAQVERMQIQVTEPQVSSVRIEGGDRRSPLTRCFDQRPSDVVVLHGAKIDTAQGNGGRLRQIDKQCVQAPRPDRAGPRVWHQRIDPYASSRVRCAGPPRGPPLTRLRGANPKTQRGLTAEPS